MSNFVGTRWARKADLALIVIESDAESSGGRSNRSLRARNENTNRAFWVTPEGLSRNYDEVTDWEV